MLRARKRTDKESKALIQMMQAENRAPVRSFDDLSNQAKGIGKRSVAIPVADDGVSISTAVEAGSRNLASFYLIGNRERIKERLAAERNARSLDCEIIHEEDPEQAARMAVLLAAEGKADMIMKGHLQTYQLMKAVLKAEKGLRTGRLLSDVFLFEDPRPDVNRLVAITDGGINVLPDLQQKKHIIENAVEVYHELGYASPKVALLCAVEVVSDAMKATIDARDLVEMYRRGEIKGCRVDGPLALDGAICSWCAEVKGIKSEVAGDADILVVPNIEAGNMLAKSVVYYLQVRLGHTIMGAKVPILINSRTDTIDAKLNSILLGMIISRR